MCWRQVQRVLRLPVPGEVVAGAGGWGEWRGLGSWGWLISCRAGPTGCAGRVMPDQREVAGAELVGTLEPPGDRRLAPGGAAFSTVVSRARSRTMGDWAADSMRSSRAVRR